MDCARRWEGDVDAYRWKLTSVAAAKERVDVIPGLLGWRLARERSRRDFLHLDGSGERLCRLRLAGGRPCNRLSRLSQTLRARPDHRGQCLEHTIGNSAGREQSLLHLVVIAPDLLRLRSDAERLRQPAHELLALDPGASAQARQQHGPRARGAKERPLKSVDR